MSKIIAALVASTFAIAAFAQAPTNTPTSQPPAGVAAKAAPAATDTAKPLTDKQEARKAKRAARKMKRAEKVGNKPIN